MTKTPKSTPNSLQSKINSLSSEPKSNPAFTIVELLVVIVVIAILAAITIVSYTGISNRAVASSLQSDLDNNSRLLKLYYTDWGTYPTVLSPSPNYCPTSPYSDPKYCLKPSNGNVLYYTNLSSTSFKLIATNTNSSTSYKITDNTSPTTNNNLLNQITTGDNASFEDGTVGGYLAISGTATLSNATGGWHESKCLKATAVTSESRGNLDVTAITTNAQYTMQLRIKAGNSAAVGKQYYVFLHGNSSGSTTSSTLTLTTDWQYITVTKTWSGDAARLLYPFRAVSGTSVAGDEVLIDAIQLESGSNASSF